MQHQAIADDGEDVYMAYGATWRYWNVCTMFPDMWVLCVVLRFSFIHVHDNNSARGQTILDKTVASLAPLDSKIMLNWFDSSCRIT